MIRADTDHVKDAHCLVYYVTANGTKIFSITKTEACSNFKINPTLLYDELSIDDEALDLVRNPPVLVYIHIFVDEIFVQP